MKESFHFISRRVKFVGIKGDRDETSILIKLFFTSSVPIRENKLECLSVTNIDIFSIMFKLSKRLYEAARDYQRLSEATED
jgi:hypothetical protein